MSNVQLININQLSFGPEIQIRVKINIETVVKYASCMATMKDIKKFPPVVVYYDGKRYWLADGHHRRAAAEQAGHKEIWAEIREGTVNDAIWEAIVANGKQGLGLSIEDRKRAITIAITKWPERSTTLIAEALGCHQTTVSRIKSEVMRLHNLNAPETVIGKDGKSYPTTKKNKVSPSEVQFIVEDTAQTSVTESESSKEILSKNVPCIEELDYVHRTTLKNIRQDDPGHLLGALGTHFPKGFIADLILEGMEFLQEKKGDVVTTPLLAELNKRAKEKADPKPHTIGPDEEQSVSELEISEFLSSKNVPSIEEPDDVQKTTLKGIRRDNPRYLIHTLESDFREGYIEDLILKGMDFLYKHDGEKVTIPLLTELNKRAQEEVTDPQPHRTERDEEQPVTESETSQPSPPSNVPCIEELIPPVAITTLQSIRQDDPDHLLSNLNMHFREGYIEDLVIKAMAYLHKKKGETVTASLLKELNNTSEYLHKHTDGETKELNCAEATVKLKHADLHDTESLVTYLFSLFDAEYRKQLVIDLFAKIEEEDDPETVKRIKSRIHEHFSKSKANVSA